MTIVDQRAHYTNSLPHGHYLTVVPGVSANVHIHLPSGDIKTSTVSVSTRFGPYHSDVNFKVEAIDHGCLVTESPDDGRVVTGDMWDDLRFPVQGINPAGATDAPSVDNVLADFPGTLLFSGSQENVIAGVAQMPHSWVRGSAIRPHIHWSKPTGSASAVTWEFYYRHLGLLGDVAGAWVGPVAGTLVPVSAPGTTNAACITTFGDLDMTGKRESSCIAWQIRRQGSSDSDNGTARLYEFDIHYQVGKAGTITEIPA